MSAAPASAPTAPAQGAPASAGSATSRTVSLRGLDQHSGSVVARVTSTGNPVTITDRGRPVAQIVPLRVEETPYERLLREGRVRPAKRPFEMPTVRITLPEGMTIEQLLAEDREEMELS